MRKVITAVLLLTLAGAACQKGMPTSIGSASTPVSSPTMTASPIVGTPVAKPVPKQNSKPSRTTTMDVRVWYVVAGANRSYLAPETHTIPYTPAVARAALEELIHGKAHDGDHVVPYSKKARIRSLSIANRIATVDWSAEVLRDHKGGAEVESLGIQQVVYTLTEFSTISEVRFTVEGKSRGTASNGSDIESWWGHVGLDGQPFVRANYIDVVEPIILTTPAESSHAPGSLALRGEVVAPDGSHRDVVRIVLRNAAGREVTSTVASVTYTDPYGHQPWRTTFAKTLTFTVPSSAQTWTVSVAIHNMHDDGIEFAETRHVRVG